MALAETTLDWPWIDRNGDAVYRGPDRRQASTPVTAAHSARPFGIYLVTSQLLLVAILLLGSWSATGTPGSTTWLTPSVAVISALAAGLSAVRWRLMGDAAALWVAAALLTYSAANVAFPDLLGSLAHAERGATAFAVLRPTSVIVVMVLLLTAAGAPKVDASLRPRRLLWVVAAAAGVAAAASLVSAEIRLLFGPTIDEAPVHGTTALGQIGVAGLWLSLAVVFLWRAGRDWGGADAWLGVMLIGLAEARLALAMSVEGDPAWLLASQVSRLLGVVAVLIGVLLELERSFARQRSTLLVTGAELSLTQARHEAAVASAEERAHDLHAALAGIASAALTLDRYHEHLDDDERTGLARAVSAEIVRLQQIVADVRSDGATFDLARTLDPVIRCARTQGTDVRTSIADELLVSGSGVEIAEVVQNLLDNARRHAPGAVVEVRAARTGDRVVVHVDDRGPGVDPALRDRIFERGCHGDDPDSSGIGLYVASRLVCANGGELLVGDRPGGGASFSFSLPIDRSEESG